MTYAVARYGVVSLYRIFRINRQRSTTVRRQSQEYSNYQNGKERDAEPDPNYFGDFHIETLNI
jgi:hypothetical protein